MTKDIFNLPAGPVTKCWRLMSDEANGLQVPLAVDHNESWRIDGQKPLRGSPPHRLHKVTQLDTLAERLDIVGGVKAGQRQLPHRPDQWAPISRHCALHRDPSQTAFAELPQTRYPEGHWGNEIHGSRVVPIV
jgi:hypothetical protein